MRTAYYYSKIPGAWHEATGYSGGPFKKYVLNDYLIQRIGTIDGKAILELGAGNGYFLPLLRKRCAGQKPSRLVIINVSSAL